MSVFKRSGSPIWQIEFQHNGQRYRESSGTPVKADAQAREAQMKAELREAAIHGGIEELTLTEGFERYYVTRIKPTAKQANANKVLDAIGRIQRDLGPETLLSELTTPVLTRWRDSLRRATPEGDSEPGIPLAPASKNRYRDTLLAMLRMAHDDWGALAKMPRLPRVKQGEQVTRWLTEDEEQRLLEASSEHLRELLTFLLDTGARKSEAVGLEWPQVRLDVDRPVVQFINTKGGRPRGVPVPNRTAELLRRLHDEESERGGARVAAAGHVFMWIPPGTSEPVPYADPKKGFRAARTRAGLGSDVTIHVMRHTYASRLVMRGESIYDVSKLLGHSSVKMTERYAHLAPDHLEATVAALDR